MVMRYAGQLCVGPWLGNGGFVGFASAAPTDDGEFLKVFV
jgi:hypothetical protein